jgi:hypothetical protein
MSKSQDAADRKAIIDRVDELSPSIANTCPTCGMDDRPEECFLPVGFKTPGQ